jgi:hypothetical protein
MIKDNAPVKNTCPSIDMIIESIHHGEYDKEELISMIEEVRQANATLRSWGNELFSKLDKP